MRNAWLILLVTCSGAWGQTQIFRESFGFGPNHERPKGGKGRMEPSTGGFSGYWAEYPSNKNTAWMTADGKGSGGWRWASSTPNPYEAPSSLDVEGENGLAWCSCAAGTQAALLAPMASPKVKYVVSADLLPSPEAGHYTAVGVTNSNVVQDNFESGAAVWVRVRAHTEGGVTTGMAELLTQGLSGPSAAVQVSLDYGGFNHVELVIDPVGLTATARVSGVVVGTLPIAAGTTRYVGFEGTAGADNLMVKLVP
ncbi:MAG: hypothetical protein JNM66_01410 [Bryobacterales bacterium]|nr:hypothetical protein [Bryobacterales bacterium]